MLFNSIEFLLFFPIVFLLYWFIFNNTIKIQNLFILIVSYIFYGAWDWRFLLLITFSTIIDYSVGIGLSRTDNDKRKKQLVLFSICVNIGFLFFFKYCNFFIQEFHDLLESIGYKNSLSTLNIILPVGISFYTFQTLSYSIDVYRKKIEPTTNFINFAAFVSFFPQLVAGPIERASNLLPQFSKERVFSYSRTTDGLRQILLGFFKKIVIADNCAIYVDSIFQHTSDYGGLTLIIGVILFAFQLYCDFSGYSDIAIGTARILGFDLIQNFNTPYFSKSISELWRRWHISLSTWANEYIFHPFVSHYSKLKKNAILLGLLITFVLIGFWHGANWTFIFFGFWHGSIVVLEYMTIKERRGLIQQSNFVFPILGWVVTMIFWLIGLVFFRSPSISEAFDYFNHLVSNNNFFILPEFNINQNFGLIGLGLLIVIFILMEWIQQNKEHTLKLERLPSFVRWPLYLVLSFIVMNFGISEEIPFIYFQF